MRVCLPSECAAIAPWMRSECVRGRNRLLVLHELRCSSWGQETCARMMRHHAHPRHLRAALVALRHIFPCCLKAPVCCPGSPASLYCHAVLRHLPATVTCWTCPLACPAAAQLGGAAAAAALHAAAGSSPAALLLPAAAAAAAGGCSEGAACRRGLQCQPGKAFHSALAPHDLPAAACRAGAAAGTGCVSSAHSKAEQLPP